MNNNWKNHLISQGAEINENGCSHFGNPESEKTAALQGHVLCDLSHYGLIRVSGVEAESFLQNQFCNDVHRVNPALSQLNGYCTPKGRVLALFRLFQHGDDYLLRLPREILEPTLKRLRMFVLMSKVTLEDDSNAQVSLGYSGPEAAKHLTDILGGAPAAIDECLHTEALSVIRVRGPHPRFEIHGDEAAVRELWGALSAQARPAGGDAWALLDIHAGLPEVVAATQEAFVPQMLNLPALDALSFQKGCYPGQEIVARMHYLGKLKRRMYRAHANTDDCPQPGDNLFTASTKSGQGAGKVVQAQTSPTGGVDLLAVIGIASMEQHSLHLHDADGPALTPQDLPYITEEVE
ncbi:MAG TPA: folate-binding protein [Gammaproteobacteria bacterium]|nr:folate-binding protein [Gammaproteobacteria bacterium]